MDYQCAPCRKLSPAILQWAALNRNHVSLIVRNYPLTMHPYARRAAEIAEEARQVGQFVRVHSILVSATLNADKLRQLANQLNLPRNLQSQISKTAKDIVNSDLKNANLLHLTGTPSLLLLLKNGKGYRIKTLEEANTLLGFASHE